MKCAVLLSALLAACNTLPPEILPPPYGPLDTPNDHQTHLFFPTGLAVTGDGALLVANSNINRTYDFGSVVGLPPDYVAQFFGAGGGPGDLPLTGSESAVIIGNYAGPLVLDDTGTHAFTASRDTGVLNEIAVGAGGAVSCPANLGTSSTDCRNGLVNLKTAVIAGTTSTANLDGPYSIVRGNYIRQGTTTPADVYFVSSVVPHIDTVSNGIIATSSQVAALDAADPATVLFAIQIANALPPANGWAPGPLAFDNVRRRLYGMGCYSRFSGTGAAEPGTAKCSGNTSNLLRIVDVDAQGASDLTIFDLYADVLSTETTQIALADPDPVTSAPTTLYATMRNPDALVQIALPLEYSQPPRVRRVVPMPISPSDMLRIERAGQPDLIAVVAERSGSVAIYDVGRQAVVSVVEGLGDSPYTIARLPCPAAAGNAACLAVSVFGECRVGFIQVPLDAPWNAALRGRGGTCL